MITNDGDQKIKDNESENKQNTSDNQSKRVAILDAGSQYGKLIDRRIRELNIESILIPFDSPKSELLKYGALVISGGPSSVYSVDAPKYDPDLFNLNIPILAICYGFQLMVHVFKGEIEGGHEREDGQFELEIDNKSRMFENLNCKKMLALLTHGDIVKSMPKGSDFCVTSKSSNGIISSGENAKLNIYGTQFHPEVDLTPKGKEIFAHFLFKIAGLKPNYTLDNRMQSAIDYIQKNVKKHEKVLCLVSGGVDSSVCVALLHKALPSEQIYPVHIDHGFMRYRESEGVIELMKSIGINNLFLSKSAEYFSNGTTVIGKEKTLKLCETIAPEKKRKIIGDLFMKLSDEIIRNELKLDPKDMLIAQGTLRPDLIESASKIANSGSTADVIKTHHNDTALVRQLRDQGRVIEPLTDYHKDEVRMIAQKLGLPKQLIWRQPFPGPGLAIRILCCDGTPYTTKDDAQIIEKLGKDFSNEVIRTCLLGIRTVGVQGDGRSYSHCVGLTLKNDYKQSIPWKQLYAIAKHIPRSVHNINRCVFIFGSELNGKQQSVTATHLDDDAIEQLRKCDRIVNDKLVKHDLTHTISQVPVILFPSNFGAKQANARSVCIRTFITNDFMTGVPAIVGKDIQESVLMEMVKDILEIDGIQRVAFDLTPKPPATTEWE